MVIHKVNLCGNCCAGSGHSRYQNVDKLPITTAGGGSCATIFNLKACWKRKADLVLKTDKYLLNSTNSLDSYIVGGVCLCVRSRLRKMLLKMSAEFCMFYNKYSQSLCP